MAGRSPEDPHHGSTLCVQPGNGRGWCCHSPASVRATVCCSEKALRLVIFLETCRNLQHLTTHATFCDVCVGWGVFCPALAFGEAFPSKHILQASDSVTLSSVLKIFNPNPEGRRWRRRRGATCQLLRDTFWGHQHGKQRERERKEKRETVCKMFQNHINP